MSIRKRIAKSISVSNILRILPLCVLGFIVAFPFLWMLSSSFKSDIELFRTPPTLIPENWIVRNYVDAWQATDFPRYMLNSGIVVTVRLFFLVLLSSSAGYVFGRLRFPGKGFLFITILGTMMVPTEVTMVPRFILMRYFPFVGGNNWLGQGGIGLVNSYAGLILPGVVSAYSIFLMRQFFVTLPGDLEDAARIDGCSEVGIFWRIFFPLVKPGATTVLVLNFVWTWNEFVWPIIVTTTSKMRTIQVGLSIFQGEASTEWALLMAASTISLLPSLVVFLLAQKHFVQGIAHSGMKM